MNEQRTRQERKDLAAGLAIILIIVLSTLYLCLHGCLAIVRVVMG